MRGRSSGKTAPPATRASPGKAGGLKFPAALHDLDRIDVFVYRLYERYCIDCTSATVQSILQWAAAVYQHMARRCAGGRCVPSKDLPYLEPSSELCIIIKFK